MQAVPRHNPVPDSFLMYPSLRPTALLDDGGDRPTEQPPGRGGWVAANVVYLGLTSLFTDVSSEMVNAILPLYLVTQLRFTPFEFFTFNGIYLAVAGLMSVAGAVIADRHTRHKEVAGGGYGLSAAARLGLLATRRAPLPATGMLFADRVGKGVRSAPRDALISLSSEPSRLGRAFGVHRAFDSAGAVAGPIVAFLVLRAAPEQYDAVFVLSFLVALIGLGVLVLFVESRRDVGQHRAATWRGALALFERPEFRTLVFVGALFGLFTIADPTIYYTILQRSNFQSEYFPLLYVGTAISYLVLAVPFGTLADRAGRSRVFLAGYVLLVAVYLLLRGSDLGGVQIVAILALLGAFYACTDGVLIAMASTAIPREQLSSGIAVLTTAAALSALITSVVFAKLWEWWGSATTIDVFALALCFMTVAAAGLLRVRTRRFG